MTTRRLIALALVIGGLTVSVAAAATSHRPDPSITGFAFSPRTFAVTTTASGASAARPVTTIRFRLSRAAARVSISVARVLQGRKVGRRCVKPSPRLSKRRACARRVFVGTLTQRNVGAGSRTLGFSGRLHGRALARGRYVATITAVDGRRHRSTPRRTTITVVAAGGSSPAPPTAAGFPPTAAGFPTPSTTGVPAGWTPKHTTSGDLTVTTPGAVVDGELVTGTLFVHARNVTIRNSWIYGSINNQAFAGNVGIDYGGMLVEDTDIGPPSGAGGAPFPGILVAGYTARRVHIHNIAEGFRVADFNDSGAPVADRQVVIQDSYVHLERGDCSHNDGIQGYGEPPRTIIDHNTIDTTASGPDCTTGAIFIGNDNADLITVTNNLLLGGGITLRLGGPGANGPGGTYDHVSGNRIVNDSWGYGPVYVGQCSVVQDWSQNSVVTVDASYRVTSTVRPLNSC
jgi:pectate lyase